MTTKGADQTQTNRADQAIGCCSIESIITVDERGQMVLPKDLRDRANIRAGDKLAVVSWKMDGKTCCISLIKVDDLTGLVRQLLGPVAQEILKEKGGES